MCFTPFAQTVQVSLILELDINTGRCQFLRMFSTGSNRYRLAFGDATIADILGLSMAGNAFIAMHIVNIITVLVIVLGNVAVVKLNWRSGESCVKSSDMLPKRIYCVKEEYRA